MNRMEKNVDLIYYDSYSLQFHGEHLSRSLQTL